MKAVIGITSYDNDHELWETHIGNKNGDLLYSVWGKTEQESKTAAHILLAWLNQYILIS